MREWPAWFRKTALIYVIQGHLEPQLLTDDNDYFIVRRQFSGVALRPEKHGRFEFDPGSSLSETHR